MDVSKLRTADGREVEWTGNPDWFDLATGAGFRIATAWSGSSLQPGGWWSAGINDSPLFTERNVHAVSLEDAQRQAVAYLLSTGELVQAGPTREELLERALRELRGAMEMQSPAIEMSARVSWAAGRADRVLNGENPWADEETP